MSVVVIPHDPRWARIFEEEAPAVAAGLGPQLVQIHHVGSTSIPGIYAKPVVDMLAEVRSIEDVDPRNEAMASLGYEAKGEYGIEGRRYFRKSTPEGVRAFHLHVFQESSPHSQRMLAFRDYLRAHSDAASSYSDLKRRLVSRPIDSDAYVSGKDALVKALEQDALTWAKRCSPTGASPGPS
jgi:GrpB-like predicted nucleotidyltransferase (UPF0157 family)